MMHTTPAMSTECICVGVPHCIAEDATNELWCADKLLASMLRWVDILEEVKEVRRRDASQVWLRIPPHEDSESDEYPWKVYACGC